MAAGGGVGGWGTPAAIFEGTWKEGKQKAGVGQVSEALPPPHPAGSAGASVSCHIAQPDLPGNPIRHWPG